MDVVPDVPADPRVSQAVDPGVRALDDPPYGSEAGAVRHSSAGDDRFGAPASPADGGTCRSRGPRPANSWRGRWRSRPVLPRMRGTASRSGRSRVTSWRLPPVRVMVGGVPRPSVITWCFEPGQARSTGPVPVLGRRDGPGGASRRSPPATGPARRRGATRSPTPGAAGPALPPRAGPAASASRSCPSRSRAPAAATPTGCPCAARTEFPAGSPGRPAAGGLSCEAAAAHRQHRQHRQQRLDRRSGTTSARSSS